MRILLVMLFGLVLAAWGESYSEIEGYKIGKPLEDKTGYEIDKLDYLAKVHGDFTTYWKSQPNEFFDVIDIVEKDGKVVLIGLESSASSGDDVKKAKIKEYIDDFMRTSKDKWGEPELASMDDDYSQWKIDVSIDKNKGIGGVLLIYSDSYLKIDYLERDFFYELIEVGLD